MTAPDTRRAAALDPGLVTALDALVAAARPLVALDFDGTLAPLVDDRDAARALPGSSRALEDLAALGEESGIELALVSGRPLETLAGLASPPSSVHLVGSHGAEVHRAGDGDEVDPLDEHSRALLGDLVERLEAVAADNPGTEVETKPIGAVLHVRRADIAVASRAVRAAVDGPGRLPGVSVMQGKDVVELSVVETDKGRALRALREALGADPVLYAGDDVTDEHAFAVLDPERGDVPIKVGDGRTAARFRVAGPEAVTALLEHLLEARRHRQAT